MASSSVILIPLAPLGTLDVFEHLLYSLSKSSLGDVVFGDCAERRASFSSALPRILRLQPQISHEAR